MEPKNKTIYKEIQPALEIFEMHRQEAEKKNKQLIPKLIGIGILILILLFFLKGIDWHVKYGIGLASCTLLFFFSNYYKKQYLKRFTKDVLQVLLSRKGINAEVEPHTYIDEVYFHDSQLFKTCNRFSGQCYIKGENEKQTFACSQLMAAFKLSEDDKITTNDLVFEGYFYSSRIKHNTQSTIVIESNDFSYDFPNRKASASNSKSFNDLFSVYFDAKKGPLNLSQDFKTALRNFKLKYNIPFVLKIENMHVYIALSNQYNLFPIYFYNQADDEKTFTEVEEGCEFVGDIVKLVDTI